jgi:hypothetical protein
MLPIGGGYPQHYPLGDLLTMWNADIVSLPRSHGAFSSLRFFDARKPDDVAEAMLYRRAEVPFVIRHVPEQAMTIAAWQSDEHLVATMGRETQYLADVNDDNHFMYYHKGAARGDPSYKPPTGEASVTMRQWLDKAYSVSAAVLDEEARMLPPGWAAADQNVGAPANGVNEPANNGDAAAWAANGGNKLKAAAAAASGAGAGARPPQIVAGPPERERRELWYLRASTSPRAPEENKWIHECVVEGLLRRRAACPAAAGAAPRLSSRASHARAAPPSLSRLCAQSFPRL